MRDRCANPESACYHRYGGRGISICEAWSDYNAFHDWALGNGYRPDLTLDRIANDGPYSPDNCRWATSEMQASNRSDNVRFEINGEPFTLSQACRKYGLQVETVRQRIERGWTDSELFGPAETIVMVQPLPS